jgi:hypothetical protein
VGGICSCWLAWQMDFCGLHEKASLACSMFLSLLRGYPGHFLQMQLCCEKFRYNSLIKFSEGGSFLNLVRYCLCTTVTDFVVSYQKQHCTFSCGVAILFNSHMQHLSGRKENHWFSRKSMWMSL